MTLSSQPPPNGSRCSFEVGNSFLVVIDGPGDTTRRPRPPYIPYTPPDPPEEKKETPQENNNGSCGPFEVGNSFLVVFEGPGDTTRRPRPSYIPYTPPDPPEEKKEPPQENNDEKGDDGGKAGIT